VPGSQVQPGPSSALICSRLGVHGKQKRHRAPAAVLALPMYHRPPAWSLAPATPSSFHHNQPARPAALLPCLALLDPTSTLPFPFLPLPYLISPFITPLPFSSHFLILTSFPPPSHSSPRLTSFPFLPSSGYTRLHAASHLARVTRRRSHLLVFEQRSTLQKQQPVLRHPADSATRTFRLSATGRRAEASGRRFFLG
jgi:hypothetical protein